MEDKISSVAAGPIPISQTIPQKEGDVKQEKSFCIGVSDNEKKRRFLGHKNNLTWNCRLSQKSMSELGERTHAIEQGGISIEYTEPINDVNLHTRDGLKKICSTNNAMTEAGKVGM